MRRSRLVGSLACLALLLPAHLFTASAEPLVPTPICGDSTGATTVLPTNATTTFAPAAAAKKPAPSVTIATLNTLHGLDDTGDVTLEERLVLQAGHLARDKVDIVGGQEFSRTINHGNVTAKLAFEASRLTRTVWYWCWYGSNPHFPGEPETRDGGGGPISDLLSQNTRPGESKFEEGESVLSRYPILAAEALRLPPETLDTLPTCLENPGPDCLTRAVFQARGALWARVRTPLGDVDVITAHTSGTVMHHEALMEFATAKSGGRAAIVCDCNALEGSDAMTSFTPAGWIDTFRALNRRLPGFTSSQDVLAPRATVDHRIDYVLSNGLRGTRSAVFMSAPAYSATTEKHFVWPSDHFAVRTTFTR